ncbi:MAG: flippase-like domain-containing protein [Polyangiaceae bacterium]|nr:flippase-like domain-containing protein [Polyangiaceae bacterium]
MASSSNRAAGLVRAFGVVLAALVLIWTFRRAEGASVALVLAEAGPWVCVGLVPFGCAQLLEALAWRACFQVLGQHAALRPLLGIRLASEALAQTLPLGMLVAESTSPPLLVQRCGLGVPEALAGMAVRKYLLLATQVLYFGGALVLGGAVLHGVSETLTGGAYLEVAAVGAVVVLVLLTVGMQATLSRGHVARWFLRGLAKIPLRRVRRAVMRRSRAFEATDRQFADVFSVPRRRWAKPAVLFLLAWCCETAETALLLHLLGVRCELEAVAMTEVCMSFLRHLAFASPGGLGVQDFGYVSFLGALGVPDALHVGAAFVLLKRGKELLWSAVGYGFLLGARPVARPAMKLSASCG